MNILWFLRQGNKKDPHARELEDQLIGFRRTTWITLVGLAIFVIWASFASLDEITRAQGSVIASSRTQVIQSQEGGTIEAILVKEGDIVEAGEILVQIEQTRAETSFLEARARAIGLSATAARLRSEIFGSPPKWPEGISDYPDFKSNQASLLTKRREAINEEVQSIEAILKLVRDELNMLKPLLSTGDVSRTEVLRLQRQEADLMAQITNKKNKYFQDAQAEMNRVEEELAGVQQTLTQRKNQLEQTTLKAPLRGIVKNVRVTTRGGVLRPGEEVMQIVPLEDDLVIEAKVLPTDIAFLKPGLEASVKVDAYDATIYGTLPGTLTYISPDTLVEETRQGSQAYYRVQVRTTGRQFSGRPDADLEIQPGMTALVEIKTGSKTVLQYLTKPVTKTLSEALGER